MATYREPLTDEEYFLAVERCAGKLSDKDTAAAARQVVEDVLCEDDVILELMERGLTIAEAEVQRAALTAAIVAQFEKENPLPTGDHGGPYPHHGGCEGCKAEDRCNVCGQRLGTLRCTNGRCRRCHDRFCGPGGGGSNPGHGYGDFGAIRAAVLAGLNGGM